MTIIRFIFFWMNVQSDGSDGERSERSSGGGGGGERRAGAESRRFMGELFPALEQQLVALVGQLERHDR